MSIASKSSDFVDLYATDAHSMKAVYYLSLLFTLKSMLNIYYNQKHVYLNVSVEKM